jgi:tRNA (mo5U34)-methyltransferase
VAPSLWHGPQRLLVPSPPMPATAVTEAVDAVSTWYHTLELPGGVLTPGWFDLRGLVDALPWPEVRGLRCLDVGTYDGFYAFELERRGAAEVLATDIADHDRWDWPAAARAAGGAQLAALVGPKGRGFEVAREALGSSVRKLECSVYDLSAEELGQFDVVVCGSLMLHLRDPVRALEAIRSVCRGWFLSIEEVSLWLSRALPHRPVAEMRFSERSCQWWVVNVAGHRRMLEIAGFAVDRATGPYSEPFGAGHPASVGRTRRLHLPLVGPRDLLAWGVNAALTGTARGVPHAAALARPRLQAPRA